MILWPRSQPCPLRTIPRPTEGCGEESLVRQSVPQQPGEKDGTLFSPLHPGSRVSSLQQSLRGWVGHVLPGQVTPEAGLERGRSQTFRQPCHFPPQLWTGPGIQKSGSELLHEHEFDILIKKAISRKGVYTQPKEAALRRSWSWACYDGHCLEVMLHKLYGALCF